jgi:hypothetical protein
VAMPCTICGHPERDLIDEALNRKVSGREVARLFDLPESSVRRHRNAHLDLVELPEPPEAGVPGDGAGEEADPAASGDVEDLVIGVEAAEEPEAYVEDDAAPPEEVVSEATGEPEEGSEENPQLVAERLYEQEEQETRRSRIAELAQKERGRQEAAAAQRRREEARAAARQRLAALRGELPTLDDEIQRRIDALAEAIAKRTRVERELYAALAGAGTPYYGTGLKPHLRQYLSIKLPEYVPGASFDALRGAPLRERDPMVTMFGAPPDAA